MFLLMYIGNPDLLHVYVYDFHMQYIILKVFTNPTKYAYQNVDYGPNG